MIYLIYGTDREKAKKKYQALVDDLLRKKPDASFSKLFLEDLNEDKLLELIQTQGLFENRFVVAGEDIFSTEKSRGIIFPYLKDIGESKNIFIFFDGELNKTIISKIKKNAEKIEECVLGDVIKKEKKEFNVFSLTDAFSMRNKKELWLLYHKAIASGLPAEEIFWKLVWQIKTMLVAIKSKDAKESGLHPFVYSKAINSERFFKKEELEKFSFDLLSIYHDSRRGITNIEIETEKFILGV